MNENGGIEEEEDHDMEIQQYCDAPTTRSAWLKPLELVIRLKTTTRSRWS